MQFPLQVARMAFSKANVQPGIARSLWPACPCRLFCIIFQGNSRFSDHAHTAVATTAVNIAKGLSYSENIAVEWIQGLEVFLKLNGCAQHIDEFCQPSRMSGPGRGSN